MHILSLSLEGNVASFRQTTGLAAALSKVLPEGTTTSHFSPQVPSGAASAGSNLLVTWKEPLSAAELAWLPGTEHLGMTRPWPDLVVSCRPEVAAIALGLKEASGGRTKIVQIQSPNDKGGVYRFDRSAFDVIVGQPQEGLKGGNVVTTKLALHGLTPQILNEKRRASHEICRKAGLLSPHHPIIAVFVGGSDENLEWGGRAFQTLAQHIQSISSFESRAFVPVLTSRRTGEEGEAILRRDLYIKTDNRGSLWQMTDQIFFNKPKDYMALLTHADAFVVTSESLSMVSEALATGTPVFVDDLDGFLQKHPLAPIMDEACASGLVKPYTAMVQTIIRKNAPARPPVDETPHLAQTIVQRLGMGR